MEQSDKSLLIEGSSAGDDFEVVEVREELFVGSVGELVTGEDGGGGSVGSPEAYLFGDLDGGVGGVTGDDFDVDAGVGAGLDGVRDGGSDGVGDGGEAEEGEVGVFKGVRGVVDGVAVGRKGLVGEGDGAHGLVLVGGEELVDMVKGVWDVVTEAEDDFGSAFEVEGGLVGVGGVDEGGHELTFGGEGELVNGRVGVAKREEVDADGMEVEQEGGFGGVTEGFGVSGVGEVEEGGGVGGDSFMDEVREVVRREEVSMSDGHEVLGEGTGFVGADDGGGAHGFAGMELADEVVVGEHALHGEGEGEGDGHG